MTREPAMSTPPLDPRRNAYRADLAAETLRGRVEAPRYVAGEHRQVVHSATPVRGGPNALGSWTTEALFGELVTVYEGRDGWAWVQLERDGYVGYMRSAALTAQARHTLRTAGTLTGDPVVALETLNRELLARPGPSLCSVAALAIDEDPSRPVRLAIAGHSPPLLVDRHSVVEATVPAPVLGAFEEASWAVEHVHVGQGQQLVVVTDGITEALGAEGRFGEERLHAQLNGVVSPALAALELEGALYEFTAGDLDDDAAILAIGPTSAHGELAPERDRELVERLFDAFFSTKEGGLGLGLSISRTIVEAHGGRLWATPNEGQGAAFQFMLPIRGESGS